jgi:farnesyl diphosphate synthase
LGTALYLSNWTSKKDHDIVEQISLKIGHLFQAQDDYLDCFGDSFITGKIGTDIEDGKCCWPIVTALNICDQQQRGLLDKHYGRKEFESVKQVKHIYYELNLENLFKEYENNAYNEILQIISGMSHITDLPTNIFNEPLSQVYRRNK